MTPGALQDRRDRCAAVAVKLRVEARMAEFLGQNVEAAQKAALAAQWRSEADRYASLLSWELPVYGTAVAS